jgi:SAM-dependent methyltransferase
MSAKRIRYDVDAYERAMYAGAHKEGYLRVRSETLSDLVEQVRRNGRRLRILEVACGPGLSLAHLAQIGQQDTLVGIDVSAEMLQGASRNINAAGGAPRLARASATGLPFAEGTFDLVYATRFIHIFTRKESVLQELRRVVRDGGLMAIEFYARPYHLIPYLIGRNRRPWSQFLWQHPTVADVHRLMGRDVSFRPLRFGGERILRSLVSDQSVRRLLRRAWSSPLRLAVAEYFAVSKSEGPAMPELRDAQRAIHRDTAAEI